MKKVRIVIADDHNVMRTALVDYLCRHPDIEIIGEVVEPGTVIKAAEDLRPDVLLIDAHLLGHRVLKISQTLHEQYPYIHILVMSAYARYDYIVSILKAGVSGCILRSDSIDHLIQAIRAVSRNEEWLSPRAVEILIHAVSNNNHGAIKLTKRESEVLTLLASGYKNNDIAQELVITVQTVKNHVRNIFNKFGVESRVEAVLYAVNNGLVSFNERNQSPAI